MPNDLHPCLVWLVEYGGCALCDDDLGAQSMPPGYHLMREADETLYFWVLEGRGALFESGSFSDKWACYRDAIDHAGVVKILRLPDEEVD